MGEREVKRRHQRRKGADSEEKLAGHGETGRSNAKTTPPKIANATMKKKCSGISSADGIVHSSASPVAGGVHFLPHPSARHRHAGGILRRWRCLACSLVSLLLVAAAILICVAVFTHLRAEARRKSRTDEIAYLKGLVEAVNSATEVKWKARFNPFGIRQSTFNHQKALKNLTAIKEYVAHLEHFFDSPQMKEHLKTLESFPEAQLPRNFDARDKWPMCPSIHAVPNQGGCGSCYAVSAMGVAADRTCIHTNGTDGTQLSALDVIECCEVCGNCFGGDPLKAMVYWALEGVVSGGPDGCRPYAVSSACGTPCTPNLYAEEQAKRKCRKDKCQAAYYKNSAGGEYAADKRKGSFAYTLFPRKMSVDQAGNDRVLLPSVVGHFNKTSSAGPLTMEQIRTIIRKELFLYGPTTLALPLTEEFLHYDSGIFHPFPRQHFDDRIIYWHVVRLIGWGHDEDDQLFWVAVNSFGEQWGENGFFRVDTSLLEDYGLEYEAGMP
ncbi:hypothetical protein niasHT_037002 [Heterodera trifolii]|uniref:Peptidase C1A papain C-terminal domain-containing protein n=1 Tax=Heterodera trifolii TaxID=157864 RepID=A0ABD2IBP3_9BILA